MAAWLLRATSNTSSISRARLLARRLHAVVGPQLVHLRPRFLPSSPVAGSTPVVGERNDSDFFAPNVVDDAVRKLPYRKAAPAISPGRAQLWMDTKKLERSFVFGNQRESNFDIALAGIEQGSFGEFPVGLGANRSDHLIAARARAMDSAVGTSLARPLSISPTRRSTSAAQEASISWSSKMLVINRSAS